MKNLTTAAFAAALAAVGTTAAVSASYPGQQFASRAHVSLQRARTIAVRAVKGTIVSQELEYERGGSGLRYTFDVKTARGVRELGIDARDGAVLENVAEGIPSKKASEAGEKAGGESAEATGR